MLPQNLVSVTLQTCAYSALDISVKSGVCDRTERCSGCITGYATFLVIEDLPPKIFNIQDQILPSIPSRLIIS